MNTDACPGCGGFTLQPHCDRPTCAGRWCSRGECGWDSETVCERPALMAGPQPGEYPETVSFRRQFQPILRVGGFRRKPFGGWAFGDGWLWGALPEGFGVPWDPDVLYHFITNTCAFIRALPGPTEW